MKTKFTIIGITLLALLARGQTTNALYLTWNWDLRSTNDTFFVYSNTNPSPPWVYWTNISWAAFASNAAPEAPAGRVPIRMADDVMRYYVVTCSNFTGESSFSEPASVRHSLPGTGLTIGAW